MSRHSTLLFSLLAALLTLTCLQGCGESPMAQAAGTYELDKATVKAAMQAEIEKTEDAQKKAELTMGLGMVDLMTMNLILEAEGAASLEMAIQAPGMSDSQNLTGTWTLDGATISITMAEEGDEPETVTGTLRDDVVTLTLPEEEGMPFDLVFNRKPDA
ncbi:MAG: hypothetical protein ACF8NJ_02620 [Phycisphaerales bacterium JB038]